MKKDKKFFTIPDKNDKNDKNNSYILTPWQS